MKHPVFILYQKDLALFLRNKAALILTFVVPFVMIWVFGQVFGLSGKDTGPAGIKLGLVNQSTEPAALEWVAALEKEKGFRLIRTLKEDGQERPLREEDLKARIEDSDFNFAVVIPTDFLSDERFGVRLKVYSNPRNDIETQIVNGLLQKTLFGNVRTLFGQMLNRQSKNYLGASGQQSFHREMAGLLAKNFNLSEDEVLKRMESGDYLAAAADGGASSTKDDSADSTKNLFSRIIKIDTEQVAGKDVKAPRATGLVGGFAMQFLLFALSGGATALLLERDQGLYHRLLAAPVARHHILISRYIHGVLLGMVQLTVLFVSAQFMFGIDVISHLPLLLVVAAFAASACASFGMLIASLSKTVEAASGLSTLTILTMSAIGGAWFPLALMPEAMQTIAKFTIVYWAMHGFDLVLWNQTGLVPLLGTLGVLTLMAVGVMGLASYRFSRSRLFG